LFAAATRVFLREGYGAASIDKVAHEAGVSTRTIYERFKNKADLLVSVISRLVESDMASVSASADLDRLDVRQALIIMGNTLTGRACDPRSSALFRIVAAEAQRFPALAEKMRSGAKARVENTVAAYLRTQMLRGNLCVADPARAASLFVHMVVGDLHECLLFGAPGEIPKLDLGGHVGEVVDVFLYGVAARPAPGAGPNPAGHSGANIEGESP